MEFRVGIDQDKNRWIDWDGGYVPNKFPYGLWWVKQPVTLFGSCVFNDTPTLSPYGIWVREFSGSGASCEMRFDQTVPFAGYTFQYTAGHLYAVDFWVKNHNTGAATNNIEIFLTYDNGAIINGVLVSTIGDNWTHVWVGTGTAGGHTGIVVRVVHAGSSAFDLDIAGIGMREYASLPALLQPPFNSGDSVKGTINQVQDACNFIAGDMSTSDPQTTTDEITPYGTRVRTVTVAGFEDFSYNAPIALIIPNAWYTFRVWLKGTGSVTSVSVYISDNLGNTIAIMSGIDISSGDWVNISTMALTYPGSVNCSITFEIYAAGTLAITGIGVYLDEPFPDLTTFLPQDIDFDNGLPITENITPYVLGIEADRGANTNPVSMTPFEGKLKIKVNNTDQKFSPRNVDSPFWNKLVHGALVQVEGRVKSTDIWQTVWTGFFDSISADTGTTSARQAELVAVNGLLTLGDQRVDYVPETFQTATDILTKVVRARYISGNRWSWRLGRAGLGTGTYFPDPSTYLTLDSTTYQYPIAGAGIVANSSIRDFINDLVEGEQGYGYFDRHGRFNFKARSALLAADSSTYPQIVLNEHVRRADYQYKGIQATSVELTYHPKYPYTGLLWETKSENPVTISANGVRTMVVSPTTVEGFNITPFSIDPYIIPYIIGQTGFLALNGADDYTIQVAGTLSIEGQQLRLTWKSYASVPLTILAAIYGTGYYTKDQQSVIVSDVDALTSNNGRPVPVKVDLKLIADDAEATNICAQILRVMNAQSDGIFSIQYTFGRDKDNTLLSTIQPLTVGNVITVFEEQTLVYGQTCLILAVDISFDMGGGYTITHTVVPIGAA